MTGKVLVLGPTGVVGTAVTQLLQQGDDFQVITAGRRAVRSARHLRVDLLDRAATARAFTELSDVTHLVYAAYSERATMSETGAVNLAMLRHALDALEQVGAPLDRVVLIGGGKSYGEHLGPYKTPAKESDPRHLGPIFYNDQEDLLRRRASGRYTWSVLRPDIVVGPSLGSPMNLLTAIAVYAALCTQANVPLRFPGTAGAWGALHQVTDADLLAEAVLWALTSDAAADEVFNVTNGDLFRWQHLWPRIAEEFGLAHATPQPRLLSEAMADRAPEWNRLVSDHRLRPTPYEALGSSWSFADSVWSLGYDLVQSTIKIRQAGFHACRDSEESVLRHLRRLRADRYVP